MLMLQGARVRLRAMERDDLPRLCQFNNDLAVELAGGGDPPMPQSLARLEAEFDRQAGEGGRDGAGFAVEVDGLLIGHCALFNFAETARTAELGITIGDKAYWGRGYGGEAIGLLVDYGFRHHNLHRIYLTAHRDNARAIAAYRKAGFRPDTALAGRTGDVLIMFYDPGHDSHG
ncbi:MAG: GNAT family N-acetyltransferase, partial [Caldilineaceae bacterium]|nr:GNAT family N-acetyltransferase [Caldilineaceae bacterium]